MKKAGNKYGYLFHIIILFMMMTPIFFDDGGIFNSLGYESRGYPISLMIAPLYLLLFLNGRALIHHVNLIILAILFIIPFIIFNIMNNIYFSTILIGIYILPMIAGYAASVIFRNIISEIGFQRLMVYACFPVSVITIIWLSFQISNILVVGRADGSVWDIFVIYQVYVYWPTALAIFLCLQIGYKGKLATFNLIVMGLGILATGAREPLLFCFAYIFFAFIFMRDIKRLKLLVFWLIIITCAAVVLFIYFPDTTVVLKIMRQLSGEQGLTAGRLEVAVQFNWSDISPFIGTGFSEAGIFGTPHNQYLELYYRGGFIALSSLALVVKNIVFSEYKSHSVRAVLFTIMIISFNINTPLRSPYIAVIIWFLFFSNIKFLSWKKYNATNYSRPFIRRNSHYRNPKASG